MTALTLCSREHWDPSGQAAAFRSFVEIGRELLALLQSKLEEEDKLLR